MGKTIMYERIYADLLAKIQNGDYQPGDRLPSEKESAELYGVSRITAKKAMDMLAKENQINREPGRGSFVCSPAAVVEMKKESREDCQSADRCNIRWVWKRFWHTAFAGD